MTVLVTSNHYITIQSYVEVNCFVLILVMGDLSTSGDDVGIVRAPQELTHRSSQPSTHTEVFANRESLHALEAQGESEEARLERLGRERPDKFSSLWAEVGFVFSVVMSQILVVRSHYT